MTAPATPPPNLDPPFRGYIESTFDALLVFEAARRGMIPRVTRRLIERERGMVQSGAVFVFDEHESGIKRWTDGLVWSPSRILHNFLVYRETDKRANPATPNKNSTSPPQHSPTSGQPHSRPHTASLMSGQSYDSPQGLAMMQPSVMGTPPSHSSSSQHVSGTEPPPLGQGALARPRSASEGGASIDRARERQLVGSLTNSYKFKEGGLVKKTMSVSVNGFAQHMVSYYTVEDVLAGKLRSPSTIPELQALEISPEYLSKQNFRFPPLTEMGTDGVIRYRGEAEEPASPMSPNSAYSLQGFPASASGEYYDGGYPQHMTSHAPRVGSPRNRSVTVPMPIPLPPHAQSFGGPTYVGSSSAGTNYYESPSTSYAPPIVRQNSNSSVHSSASGAIRPGSSSRRFDPYGAGSATSPRSSGGLSYHNPHRRQSQPIAPENMYQPPSNASYDVKPNIYNYHPPSTAPSTFSAFYPPDQGPPNVNSPITSPIATTFAPPPHGYSTWQPVPSTSAGSTSRLMPTPRSDAHFVNPAPPSSSGSSSSGGRPGTMGTPQGMTQAPESWASHPQPTVPDSSWDGNHTPTYAQPQGYAPPMHSAHDEWSRSNTNAIV
ncbi:hypothetical protein I317_02362 [Kwoniella heveanensis CBS 569]|uniref:cAMP-independent regulatory protein n=1 Tax=Kwoniella heveanensis BCC8398 TaxID=1296120 RepID=A0A1B9GQQ8_9TREE|nr:hypothetical protein I316_05220 [Kwoniella heveanensis BCC8398]OCF43758.1 hypothetical protein I317_02362 [Kwoniella heveanensis CBS 569]